MTIGRIRLATIMFLCCALGGWLGRWQGERHERNVVTIEARAHAEAVVQGREDARQAWIDYYNSLELRRGR